MFYYEKPNDYNGYERLFQQSVLVRISTAGNVSPVGCRLSKFGLPRVLFSLTWGWGARRGQLVAQLDRLGLQTGDAAEGGAEFLYMAGKQALYAAKASPVPCFGIPPSPVAGFKERPQIPEPLGYEITSFHVGLVLDLITFRTNATASRPKPSAMLIARTKQALISEPLTLPHAVPSGTGSPDARRSRF